MSLRAAACALFTALVLSACAGSTSLILMPDASGKVGAIVVKTKDDSRLIDKGYGSVTARAGTSHLTETRILSEADVKRDYAELLDAEPSSPISFTLYFMTGSSDLVEKSRASLPQIVERIKQQMPTEIRVIGHTDTTGTDEINDKLALKRAQDVVKLLTDRIPDLHVLAVQSFGSKELLVPTPPNVDEPRNRRVEILIL